MKYGKIIESTNTYELGKYIGKKVAIYDYNDYNESKYTLAEVVKGEFIDKDGIIHDTKGAIRLNFLENKYYKDKWYDDLKTYSHYIKICLEDDTWTIVCNNCKKEVIVENLCCKDKIVCDCGNILIVRY